MNPGESRQRRPYLFLLGNQARFENMFWVCKECILPFTTSIFTFIIQRQLDFLSPLLYACCPFRYRALVSFLLLTSTPAPVVFYLYLPLSGKKSPRSGVRGVTARAVGGVRVGVKVISLCLQLLPSRPCLLALSLMLLVSLGIFVLNSCECGIKKTTTTTHNISTSLRLSPVVESPVSCGVLV